MGGALFCFAFYFYLLILSCWLFLICFDFYSLLVIFILILVSCVESKREGRRNMIKIHCIKVLYKMKMAFVSTLLFPIKTQSYCFIKPALSDFHFITMWYFILTQEKTFLLVRLSCFHSTAFHPSPSVSSRDKGLLCFI